MHVVLTFSRDTLVYAASARSDGLPIVMDILSDVVLRPQFSEDQVNMIFKNIIFF